MKKIETAFRIMSIALLICLLACCAALADVYETVFGDWTLEQYVDDFGDPIDNKYYVRTVALGTYSNAETSGSELTVHIFVEQSSISLRLLENNSVRAPYVTESDILLKYKVDDVVYSHQLYPMDAPNGDIKISDLLQNYSDVRESSKMLTEKKKAEMLVQERSFYESAFQQITSFLLQGKDIRCVLRIGNAKYNFTISADGYLDSLYSNMYTQVIKLMQSGDYNTAMAGLVRIPDGYKDRDRLVNECLIETLGPIRALLTQIQSEKSCSLKEAFAELEADPENQGLLADPALTRQVPQMKKLIECEGEYEQIDTGYKVSIRYYFEYGFLYADVTFKNRNKINGKYYREVIDERSLIQYIDLEGKSEYPVRIKALETNDFTGEVYNAYVDVSPTKAIVSADKWSECYELIRTE